MDREESVRYLEDLLLGMTQRHRYKNTGAEMNPWGMQQLEEWSMFEELKINIEESGSNDQ